MLQTYGLYTKWHLHVVQVWLLCAPLIPTEAEGSQHRAPLLTLFPVWHLPNTGQEQKQCYFDVELGQKENHPKCPVGLLCSMPGKNS